MRGSITPPRSRLIRFSIASAALASALAFGPFTLGAQKKAVPDIWGVWMGMAGVTDGDPRFRNTPYPAAPDLTDWGAAESKRLASPITPGECNPWSPVTFMGGSGLFPIQILQGPNLIVIHHEAITQPRRIYTDGRRHPPAEDLLPSFLGHSIGRWEGDTLVVDTVGTNGRARPLNGYVSGAVNSTVDTAVRLPSSDQLHVVERIRLVGGGQYLEDVIAVEDPQVYRTPWTVKRYWQRRSDIDVQEYACTDNSRRDAEGQEILARRPDEEEAVKLSPLCLAAALIAVQPAFAHHSFALFDLTKEITLVGTIKEVQFKNPHVWLQVTVPDGKGVQTEWSIEAGAPGMLMRTGWKPTTLKSGDAVTVVAHPARSGEPNGSLIRVTIPDGRTLGPGGPPPALKSGG